MTNPDPARRRRVVVADPGPGPDGGGPDASVDAVLRRLRDAGHEVIYTGPDQAPEQLAETALQEDADRIELPGADAGFVARVVARLAERGASDIEVR